MKNSHTGRLMYHSICTICVLMNSEWALKPYKWVIFRQKKNTKKTSPLTEWTCYFTVQLWHQKEIWISLWNMLNYTEICECHAHDEVVWKCHHRQMQEVMWNLRQKWSESNEVKQKNVTLQNVQCASNACNKVHVSLVLIMTRSL